MNDKSVPGFQCPECQTDAGHHLTWCSLVSAKTGLQPNEYRSTEYTPGGHPIGVINTRSALVEREPMLSILRSGLSHAEFLRVEPTIRALYEALERIADPRNKHFGGDAQVVARDALNTAQRDVPQYSSNTGERNLWCSYCGEVDERPCPRTQCYRERR